MKNLRARNIAWLVATCLKLASNYAMAEESSTKCGIYLAPSTIPGSGLGMYAGDHYYKEGDTVTGGDTVIPIVEHEWNNARAEGGVQFLWDEYTWNGNVFEHVMQDEGDDIELIMAASPGVGAAANSYLSLRNVEDVYIKIGRPTKGDSPGVGGSSPYYGREFFATNDIPPGGEIFADYGTNYFTTRPKVYGYIPMPSDFERADIFIKRFFAKQRALHHHHGKKSKAFWSEVWNVIKDMASIWEQSRMLNALPSDFSQIGAIMRDGGTARQDFNRSIREISWLEENGQCMDNIKVGQSENPDSGRGAFANRFIPQGGLVAPAPLIHIDSNSLQIYKPMDGKKKGREVPDMDGPQTFQLLLNYCFGHEKSTLLLCPYGLLTAYINHSAENPNAKIEWSKTMRHPEWLDQPIKLWEDEYHTGFQIDFVALRDIQEEEEILIDYGEAWERAWQEHVRNFVPRENYTPAYELNDMEDLVYRTIEDRPYELDAVKLWCNAWYVNRFIKSRFKPFRDMECRILKRLGEDRYVVQVVEYENDDVEVTTTLETKGILWDVPSDAFYLADMGYERDHLQFDAFRHAMMIPDEVFPEVWKTL